MKLSTRFIPLIFMGLISFASPLFADPLPNLELLGSDDKKHHINDFVKKGSWTLVTVWGPKCPACTAEMPSIQGIYDDKDSLKINVLGLVIDFPSFDYAKMKQVKQFEEDYFISFPNLLMSSSIYFDLGLGPLRGTPTIILVDPKGEVSAVQLGAVPRKTILEHIAKQDMKN